MEKENEVKVEKEKKEKVYQTKDIIITAIISFLIGAILTAGGFAISKSINKGRIPREFNENGIQRRMENGELNNSNGQQNRNFKGRPNMTDNQQDNGQNTPPKLPDNQQQNGNQNPESQQNTQNQPLDNNVQNKS